MSRRDIFLKWLFYAAASLILILLQSTVFNHLCVMQTHPFVFPILAAAAAVLEPPYESAVYALALGLLCDLTIPGVFPCFYTVTFLLAALLSAVIAAKLIVPGFWCCMACGALAIVVCDLFNILVIHYRHGTSYPAAFTLMGRELLLSVLLVPLVYLLFHWINLRVDRD